jgi:hypothetical protein
MRGHVNSSAPMRLGAAFIALALAAVTFDSPVRADDSCIEQPPQPVAEGMSGGVPRNYSVPYDYAACHSCHARATEVLLWNFRYDRAKGRKCWFLVDAYGREVTEVHMRSRAASAPTSTFSSKLASWFGNLNFFGKSENAAPESDAPKLSPPNPPSQHHGDTANAKRTDSGVRVDQSSSGEAYPAKRVSQVSIRQEERTLFEEFLRWRERERIVNTLGPAPSTR